ncbi:MAG: glycosyltransferase family 2 protein [Armatimonadetes bacterium]|nr:glycosyltransferase family 2 protein [Armatimonadota bacterium]
MKKLLNYRHKILLKKAAARILSLSAPRPAESLPPVTVFISSMGTRDSLELTLRSLFRMTRYPNIQLWIGENGSTDGSVEFLREYAKERPLRLDERKEPRRHYLWLDEVHRSVETKYWFAVDSDMLFLGRDPILEMVMVMERDPSIYLVASEEREPQTDHPAPVTGELLDLGEAPATWLLAVRTSLRDTLDTSFEDGPDHADAVTGKPFCYDTGGKLLRDMREGGLGYHYMSRVFQLKYQHFGGLSWSVDPTVVPDESYQQSKRSQLEYIRALVARERGRAG